MFRMVISGVWHYRRISVVMAIAVAIATTVVGGALMLNTIVAVSIGGLVPLALKRFGRDPALASGPILTTVTDLCGFLLSLGFATLALEKLTAG